MTEEAIAKDQVVRVGFDVRMPASATREETLEWLRLNLGFGSCKADNPLVNFDLEAKGDIDMTAGAAS